MKTIVCAIIFVGLAVVLLGVKALFIKGGAFPSHHHGHNFPGRVDRHNSST